MINKKFIAERITNTKKVRIQEQHKQITKDTMPGVEVQINLSRILFIQGDTWIIIWVLFCFSSSGE